MFRRKVSLPEKMASYINTNMTAQKIPAASATRHMTVSIMEDPKELKPISLAMNCKESQRLFKRLKSGFCNNKKVK